MMSEANDDREFLSYLKGVFKRDAMTLERLPIDCSSKTYRLMIGEGLAYFCKRARIGRQKADFLRALPDVPVLVPLAVKEPLEFKGDVVLVSAWRPLRKVPLIEMDDGQFAAFLEASRELFAVLATVVGGNPPRDENEWFETVRGYVAHHPLAGHVFKGLLAAGRESYAYSPDTVLSVCHGDFHTDNFGFAENGQLTFMDFDLAVKALPAEDLTHLVVNGMRHGRLLYDRKLRNRLLGRYREMIRFFGCPQAEWRLALDRERLKTAAEMIERKGDSVKAAREFLRRDWTVRKMYDALGGA